MIRYSEEIKEQVQMCIRDSEESAPGAQLLRQQMDDIHGQVETVQVVEHPHVEGGGDGTLFDIAPDVEILVLPAVGELMDQRGVAVEGEEDGLCLLYTSPVPTRRTTRM